MNSKKKWKQATTLMILLPALMSCTTSQISGGEVPDPLDENGDAIVKYDQETDEVKMPLWYWKKIVRYIVDTE